MKRIIAVAACAILLCGCKEHFQNGSAPGATSTPSGVSGATPAFSGSPVVQASGLVLQCLKCVFVEEQGLRYIAGQIHNEATQPVNGYVMAIDLQDEKGQSVRKIGGLILMTALPMEAGATKEFKERVSSDEKNITQAVVHLKKSGTDEALSKPLTLKLNAGPPKATAVEASPRKKSAAVAPN